MSDQQMVPVESVESGASLGSRISCGQETWLVTGAAGFIGSNLVEALLRLGQKVVGLDNFSTGSKQRLDDVRSGLTEQQWARFELHEDDITDRHACHRAVRGVSRVLHQAALGSVPRSLLDPDSSHRANVDGFMNVLEATRRSEARRLVFASSSSVYGDSERSPKREGQEGNLLSPYAATKWIDEIYAEVYHRCYGLQTIGLRYFNVFGRRQDPDGPYAAVIPRWVSTILSGGRCIIHGDGETSRDFCYIENVIQANLRAAIAPPQACGHPYNIACGAQMTLNELHTEIRAHLPGLDAASRAFPPEYAAFRAGDIRHSHADISAARSALSYSPTHDARTGLRETLSWYADAWQRQRIPK